MTPIEQTNGANHQERVEDVQPSLVLHQVAVISVDEFDASEDRTDDDEGTRDVDALHESLPVPIVGLLGGAFGLEGWVAEELPVKVDADDEEEAED